MEIDPVILVRVHLDVFDFKFITKIATYIIAKCKLFQNAAAQVQMKYN